MRLFHVFCTVVEGASGYIFLNKFLFFVLVILLDKQQDRVRYFYCVFLLARKEKELTEIFCNEYIYYII